MAADWLLEHPQLLQIQAHGSDDPQQVQAVFQAYLDLTEVKLWHRVTSHPCPQLKLVYLRAQEEQEGPQWHVLPLPADSALSMERFDQYFKALDECEKERVPDQHQPITRLTLALVDNESTVVYYHVHKGMQPWPSEAAS